MTRRSRSGASTGRPRWTTRPTCAAASNWHGRLAIEATRHLALKPKLIVTPMEPFEGRELAAGVVIVPVLRAGLGMVEPILALLRSHAPGAAFLVAGSLLYMIGTFLVTIARNVPRNDALARVAPSDPAASGLWARYVSEWTAWNHVRTAAALAAAAAFTFALAA